MPSVSCSPSSSACAAWRPRAPPQQQPPPSALDSAALPPMGAWGADADAARARAAPPPPHLPQPAARRRQRSSPPPSTPPRAPPAPIPAEGWPPGSAVARGGRIAMRSAGAGLGPGACSGRINAAAPKGTESAAASAAAARAGAAQGGRRRHRPRRPHLAGRAPPDRLPRRLQPTAPDAPEGGDRLALLSGSDARSSTLSGDVATRRSTMRSSTRRSRRCLPRRGGRRRNRRRRRPRHPGDQRRVGRVHQRLAAAARRPGACRT